MASDPAHLPASEVLTVAIICDKFLDFSLKHNTPETFAFYKRFIQSFCDHCGHVLAHEVIKHHVTQWLDKHPSWTTGRRNAVICVKRAFNWAGPDGEGLLKVNPLKSVPKPPAKSRERIITDEEREQILAAIKDQQFRDFVFALTETGCRPGEVRKLTAADVDLNAGVWVLEHHKSRKVTGKPRFVYLTSAMVELTKRLIAINPEGPIFRGPRGNRPFTANGVRCRFRELRRKLPHLKGVVAYCYRHTFATNALANGESPAIVAELLGHKDITMLQEHYSHLSQKTAELRRAAARALGCASTPREGAA